jgi:hypothetical protein
MFPPLFDPPEHPYVPEGFPSDFIIVVAQRLKHHMEDWDFMDRPVRHTDGSRSIGLYALQWSPTEGSIEIGSQEPTLGDHQLRIQTLVKHTEETEARHLNAVAAKTVRAILYRDPILRVRLHELTEEILGTVERVKRMSIRAQGYLNNELRNQFVYLTTTDLLIQTEQITLS